MRQWRNGVGNAPRHYAGTRPTAGRALSRTRSLTAAAIAVAMMATVAVTSLLPTYNAKADESHNDGAICTPTTETLGDQTSGSGNDEGIATFVGGDMYVGGKKSGITSANNNNAPEGSYAVEAEGLTAVNGKLLLHPMKQAWNIWNDGSFNRSRGFRWGIVGFGSQFRPKDGSTVLSVGGNSTNSELNWFGGAQGWTNDANQGSSWLGTGAGNGATGETNDHNFSANIAGNQTTVQSRNTWKNGEQYSVYAMGGNGEVNWNQNNNVISGVKNPSTGSDYTYSDYKNYVATLSGKLAKISSSNTVTKGNEDNYTGSRYSYSYNTYEHNVYRFDIQNNSRQTEITLTGNGKDELQVFNLDVSMLNSIGDAGVVFNFKNISDNASVAVNINGNGNNVKFRNGWQFKWNDVDISDGYVMMNSTGTNRYNNTHGQEYVKRASQLMWNFYNTNSLTILGGKGSGHINTGWYKNQNHGDKEDWYNVNVTDDPSAAWMGSVMVTGNDSGAAGNFQSHVSTNGRVWTTGDFEMYNKDVVTAGNGNFVNSEGKYSTSAVDMDQERHNLSWYGQMTTSCAAIAWNKVDDTAGHNALGGTSWTVYGKKEDAVHGTNALATIADGGWNDDADAEGSFQLGNLAKNGTYFLKESGTAEGYAQNTNIYQINTGSSTTEAATNISNVFDSAGRVISTDADELLTTDGKIINKKTGSAIEWQKVDGTDNSTLLAGSTWTLSKMNGDTAEQSWNITDDQSGTEVKSITITDASGNVVASDTTITFEGNNSQTFTATAYDQQNQVITGAKLTWSSNNATVASVDQNGTVTPTGNGDATITVKSADGNVTASFTVNVSGVTVETPVSINGYTDGQEINLEKGKTLNLIASVAPEDNTVTWSTSNADNVSLSANTGTSVTLTANKVTSSPVTITAKGTRTSKTVTLRVNVTKPPATTTTVFFKMQDDFNQNNGQKLFLEWKTATGNWPSDSGDPPNRKEMTVASGCNGYVSYTINEVMPTSASFRIRRDKANWTTPQSFYRPDANSGFAFNGGDIVTLNTATEILGTAPSGCAVTSTAAYSSRRVAARRGEHRAVASVLRTQSNVVNVLENSTVSSKKDEDTKAGKFKVSDLANGTYQLKEKAAPNGYEVSDTVYTITIANGTATWSPAFGADNTGNKIANTRKTGSVTWTKVSSDSNNANPLPGSQWTLKQTKTFSWENGVAKYIDADATLGTVTDCVNDENNVADCSTQTGEYVDLDGASGKFKISGLVWGEYQLIESKAPDGYDLDTTPHTFRIGPLEGDNIAGNWYANTGFNNADTSAYNEQTTFTVNGGNIKNKPGVILPGTGGAGDYWIYAAALVAALIGVVAAGMALKVRRRQ